MSWSELFSNAPIPWWPTLRSEAQATKPDQIPSEDCRQSLSEFVGHFWHVVEPETPLIWNWHIEAISLHLEAVTQMQVWDVDAGPKPDDAIKDLIINSPPGHMKSLITCVFWPAWEWIRYPWIQSIFSSYALELAIRDSIRCRDIVQSDQYQEWFEPAWKIRDDRNQQKLFQNTAGGRRQCVAVGAGTTGFRGHKIVVDDALNAVDAVSDTKRSGANTWWDKAASSRLNDPRKGCKVIMGQRLHEEDLTGHAIGKGYYDHLCLPSEFDPERRRTTSIGFTDPRTEPGELLFPLFFTKEVLSQARLDLGTTDYEAQHQQNPAPPGGLIFKKWWWRYWQYPNMDLPPIEVRDESGNIHRIPAMVLPSDPGQILQSWDMSFKDVEDADFVAGGTWSRHGANVFWLDLDYGRKSFAESVKAVKSAKEKWPRTGAILIEDKANGPAVISTLTGKVPGIIAVDPQGGKEARAHATSPFVEAGNVYLPHPKMPGFEWVEPGLNQLTSFPKGSHDDIVDQATQALLRIFGIAMRPGRSAYKPVRSETTYVPR